MKEEIREEKAYEIFLDALMYRRRKIQETLDKEYFPQSLRAEKESQLELVMKIIDAMFL